MPKIQAAPAHSAGAPLEAWEFEMPEPGAAEVETKANQALKHLSDGQARYRVVLKMDL